MSFDRSNEVCDYFNQAISFVFVDKSVGLFFVLNFFGIFSQNWFELSHKIWPLIENAIRKYMCSQPFRTGFSSQRLFLSLLSIDFPIKSTKPPIYSFGAWSAFKSNANAIAITISIANSHFTKHIYINKIEFNEWSTDRPLNSYCIDIFSLNRINMQNCTRYWRITNNHSICNDEWMQQRQPISTQLRKMIAKFHQTFNTNGHISRMNLIRFCLEYSWFEKDHRELNHFHVYFFNNFRILPKITHYSAHLQLCSVFALFNLKKKTFLYHPVFVR